jgi:hypothetical protein
MRCLVNDHELGADSLGCRPMNFGQGSRDVVSAKYCVEIDLDDFLRTIEHAYEKFRLESIADEPFDDGSFDEINQLRDAKWPSLEQLAASNLDLMVRVVRRFLDMDTLNAVFATPILKLNEPAYLIDSIDNMWISGSILQFSGRCYSLDIKRLKLPEDRP